MITQYGAVLENNVPSPFESYQYFDQVGQRKAALELQRREQLRKEKEAAAAAFKSAVKPIDDFRADSGRFDINKFINSQLESAKKNAEKMQLEGKGNGEITNYVIKEAKRLDALQKYYKDGMPIIEKQIAELDKRFDPNTLRDLASSEMAYVDDGKGGKRLRNEDELPDPSKILNQITTKIPEALVPKNRFDMYNFPSDTPVGFDADRVMQGDGRITRGRVTGSYNGLFQEYKKVGDGKWEVVTRSIPLERDGEVIKDEKGQPIKALPLEAYETFIQDPGRLWELNKTVKEKLAGIKKNNEEVAEREALFKIKKMAESNIDFVRMTPSQKMVLQNKIKDRILQDMDEPDEEVIRQQAAWELADKNINRKPLQNNTKEPSVSNSTTVNMGGKKDEIIPRDVFTNIKNKVGNKELSATEVGTDAMYVLKLIKSMGYKKTFKEAGQTKQIDYTPGEVKLKEEGGQLYALFDGNKLPIVPDDVNAPANSVKQEQELLKNKNKNTNTPAPKPSGSKTIPAAEWRKLSVAERQKKLQEGYKPQ